MDIVIHGTKGGCKIFTPKKLSGLLDVTADGAKTSAMGQQAYAMRFTADNTIFSKYKIIRDVRGDKRTGFVGFSLFLPNNKKLSGTDIITLLDSVSDEYCRRYIADNNLDEVKENWDFSDAVSSKYESKLKSNDEAMQSGSKDDAFVYFKNPDELKRYFDMPFQEEYGDYRQILFVKEELRTEPENPLNALRHSANDLTGKIDLENPKYKLLFKRHEVGGLNIEVKAAGRERSSGNKVGRKDVLKIHYSQKFRKSYSIEGTWEDIKRDYPGFIDVDSEKEIVVINPVQLQQEIQAITITVIDELSKKPIPDSRIICKGTYSQFQKEVNNNRIIFKGDEIGDSWYIEVMAAGYKKVDIKIIPERTPTITFELKKIQTPVSGKYKNNDDEENYYFSFKAGKHGKVYHDSIKYGAYRYYGEHQIAAKQAGIKPDFGYKFDTLSQKSAKGNYYVFEVRFKPIIPLKLVLIVSGVIAVLGIVLLFVFKGGNFPTEKEDLTRKKIIEYVEGDELILDTLKNCKAKWEEQKPEIKKGGGSWLPVTGCKEEKPDSTDFKKWYEVTKLIDDAITKRELINKKEFSKLKKMDFSKQQQEFKTAVENIDSTKYNAVKNKLVKISGLTLKQIADSINVLTSKETVQKQPAMPKPDVTRQSETPPPVPQPNQQQTPVSNTPSSKESQEKQQEQFQNDFWILVKKGNSAHKSEYDNWFKQGRKNNISSQNPYNIFYDKYLSKDAGFKRFMDTQEIKRKKATELTVLENLIKEQP